MAIPPTAQVNYEDMVKRYIKSIYHSAHDRVSTQTVPFISSVRYQNRL